MIFPSKEKSRLNWGSDDLSSHEGVKYNLLQNYLINFNSNARQDLKQG